MKHFSYIIITAIIIAFVIPTSPGYSQGLRTYEDYGGGGSGSSSQSSSSDNSLIYIVGGAAIVGIVVYALVRDKQDKKKKDDSDSTNASLRQQLEFNKTFESDLSEVKDKIPVNFFFGISNGTAYLPGKKYSFGISYRF